ncbi:hypothetical protein GCM10009533_38970 [Saccharopolyspora spinosporotrichia]|uniref:Uncharacterized protein n=1 Tax=Saccharopolyspora erythraea TaxID=1836 RepID=A0ABN1D6X4_SACER
MIPAAAAEGRNDRGGRRRESAGKAKATVDGGNRVGIGKPHPETAETGSALESRSPRRRPPERHRKPQPAATATGTAWGTLRRGAAPKRGPRAQAPGSSSLATARTTSPMRLETLRSG